MADKKNTFAGIKPEDIATWKHTKGKLTEVTIPLDDNLDGKTAKFIICKPTRNLLPAITQYGKEENVDALNTLLITNCVLGGDMDYLDSDIDVYLEVLKHVGKQMEAKRVTSKTL